MLGYIDIFYQVYCHIFIDLVVFLLISIHIYYVAITINYVDWENLHEYEIKKKIGLF